ncbi:SOUL family heme-binding protein [Nocardioides mesophilus]|uniref:SOUL family heme-binding protein n=1 Tax=Nocardioides mesophilus TaxID=433659 RepID=UPI001CB72C35|nr:heme-binding protein [Nocardioides mesophilus]
MEGSFEGAGNRAFRPLAGYLGGRNRGGAKVAMTAPVVQAASPERISATAATVQPAEGTGRYVVGFVMPAAYTRDSLPEPTDPRIHLRVVPEQHAAAHRFSGRWSRGSYEAKAAQLLKDVAEAGLEVSGSLRFARFDPPWTPWFLRHNEVVVPVTAPGQSPTDQ